MPGEKGKYCSKHREEGMVDVLYTVRLQDKLSRFGLYVSVLPWSNLVYIDLSNRIFVSQKRIIDLGFMKRIRLVYKFERVRVISASKQYCVLSVGYFHRMRASD